MFHVAPLLCLGRLRAVLRLAIVVFSLTLLPKLAAAERLRIEVGGAAFRPYPVAAPDLSLIGPMSASLTTTVQQLTVLLQADVDLARSLVLVPPKTYLGAAQESPTTPVFLNWANVGASGLVRGSVEGDNRRLTVRLRFFEVASQRELLSRSCSEAPDQADRCVHRFLDELVALLTGEKGIFSSRIAYVLRQGRGKQLGVCDLDGGHPAALTDNGSLNLLPAWDFGGRGLLFTSYQQGGADLYRMALSPRGPPQLVSRQRGLNTGAALSPDGSRIALTLSVDGNTEIYTLGVDGKDLRRLTDSWGQDVSPTWSPDGSRIAFVSSRSGQPHIYVMSREGGQPRRLTFKGTYNQEPDWSPRADGQIAFTARDEQYKYDLFLTHPDSGEITRLTQDAGHNQSPSFSPDGHHIVFTSTRAGDGQASLWIIDEDGSNPRRLPLPPGAYESPTWSPRLAE